MTTLTRAQFTRMLYGEPEPTDQCLGAWVYCGQHLRAHPSGWCSIGVRDKVGLGPDVTNQAEADEKCRRLGLKLYVDMDKTQ